MCQYFLKDKEGKYQRRIHLIARVHDFKILDDYLTIQLRHLDYLKQHFHHCEHMEGLHILRNQHLQVIQYKAH